MTKAREQLLKVAQRRMVRKMVQVARGSICEDGEKEDWVHYIIRSTRIAEALMGRAGVQDWVEEQRRRKWRWAGHIARLTDRRWTQLSLYWSPHGERAVGRPCHKWDTDLIGYLGTSWFRQAENREQWRNLEDGYAKK